MGEKSLDPQLWQACAGGMVNIPPLNSRVIYFPQGHAEHAQSHVDFPAGIRIPPSVLCRVSSLKFMADHETDEVFAKICLAPVGNGDYDADGDDDGDSAALEKPASFAKTLTQSDANNGGGFSVPRYCAETIFPRLDYAADPPVQNVVARDVHGGVWKFRHIYRGTPRRHLLTTGWSNFVNQKKLVAGDSIVFLRAETGEICVGIRRAKRAGMETHSGWNTGISASLMREESHKIGGGRGAGRVRPESVIEAAVRAANGQPFEIVYYPRLSTPEFCVKASAVKAAMRVQWCSGMRFKMPFETEDSSRISWFMGTVNSVQVCDPIRWPQSPWRLLQVAWDEPDLLQNVKRVNPWLIESVSNMPVIHLSSFSPPRKKLRLPFPQQHPEFSLDAHFQAAAASFLGNSSPLGLPSSNAPAGIQGARHALFGISLSDLHHTKLHHQHIHQNPNPGMLLQHHHHLNPFNPIPRVPISAAPGREPLSCVLTMGNSSQIPEKSPQGAKRHQFVLFGQPILTEQQISDGARAASTKAEFGLDVGHCKVFMESEDVGRTLDLTVLNSYEDLYRRLANMFGLERSEMPSRVLCHDVTGVLKQTGDEPFSDFVKTAKRLTILTDSGNKKIARTWITGIGNGENGLSAASNKTGPLSIFA